MPDRQSTVTVPSPCCRCCCLDDSEVCLGCFRSLPEILGWHDADAQQRLQILRRCNSRRLQHQQVKQLVAMTQSS